MDADSQVFSDNDLRVKLMEAILSFFEGKESLRQVVAAGITVHSRSSKNPNIAQVASELNSIGSQMANGNKLSNETINERFTEMLQKLTPK
ncbi:MAG TPA: hypothetical protein VE090_02110 [Methylomirabilota bacterium]|nr:hypothetical protein [Methylomirabilota bacterium]